MKRREEKRREEEKEESRKKLRGERSENEMIGEKKEGAKSRWGKTGQNRVTRYKVRLKETKKEKKIKIQKWRQQQEEINLYLSK